MSRDLRAARKVLGVPADSTLELVTSAYRRLARTTHPDVSGDPGAAQRFADLTAAYRLVVDSLRPDPAVTPMAASAAAPTAAPGVTIPVPRTAPRPPSSDAWTWLPGAPGRASIIVGPVQIRQAPDGVGWGDA